MPSTDDHRFGDAFVTRWIEKWSRRGVHERPLTYDIAVMDEFAERRAWYAEQIDLLPLPAANAMAGRLWKEDQIWPCTLELAAGAWVRSTGCEAAYERAYDLLTPDWTALNVGGKIKALVEVHTDQPRQGTSGRIRAWNNLVQRIATIPMPLVLNLAAPRRNATPPDAGTTRKIVADLHAALVRLQPETRISTHGYTFVLLADRRGGLVKSPNGLRCHFQAPSEIAGSVSARRIAENAASKVNKYAAIAQRHNVPLVVATGAHPFTGAELSHLDDLLEGRQTITFQFSPGDVHIGEQEVRLGQPDIWKMAPDLSSILWIDNHFPFRAALRCNPDSGRPLDIRSIAL